MKEAKGGFLITTPETDDTMFYCSAWSREIIGDAEKRGIKTKVLEKEKANRKNLEGYIEKQNPRFVVLNGHGTPNLIMGHGDEPMLELGKNEGIMRERIVFARSCYSLEELGKACVQKGATAFAGYRLPFVFIADPNRSAHPLKDKLAEPCFETSNLVPMSIIKGAPVSEAIQKANSKADQLISYWETREDLIEAPYVASCLYWNKLALGHEGKGNAKLE